MRTSYKITFGRYKGTDIRFIPEIYLRWLVREKVEVLMDDGKTTAYEAAEEELIKRPREYYKISYTDWEGDGIDDKNFKLDRIDIDDIMEHQFEYYIGKQ